MTNLRASAPLHLCAKNSLLREFAPNLQRPKFQSQRNGTALLLRCGSMPHMKNDCSRLLARLSITVAAITIVAAFYMLSVGPAWWLHAHGMLPRSIFTSFYSPLARFGDLSDSARTATNWYCNLWYPIGPLGHGEPDYENSK